MKENDWRSKLIRTFNQKFKQRGFIWANDVRYKAGFPDLYVILDGRTAHYELKLCKEDHYVDQMSKLQKAVCQRIADAGVHVSCLTYIPMINIVHVYCFSFKYTKEYDLSIQRFDQMWISGCQI